MPWLQPDADELRSTIQGLADGELMKMLGAEKGDYRPEALAYAREEMARRNLSLPENVDPGSPQRGKTGVAARLKAGSAYAGLSKLSIGLLVMMFCYTAYERLLARRNPGYPSSPALGFGMMAGLFWSFAWDARVKSGAPVDGVPQERKWSNRMVLWASLLTAIMVYLAGLELFHR